MVVGDRAGNPDAPGCAVGADINEGDSALFPQSGSLGTTELPNTVYWVRNGVSDVLALPSVALLFVQTFLPGPE